VAKRRRGKGTGIFGIFSDMIGFLGSRGFLLFLCYAAVIGGAGYGTYYFFMKSTFFDVREIVFTGDSEGQFSAGEEKVKKLCVGQNIFKVDIRGLASVLRGQYPHIHKVEARRVMPDKIELDFIVRKPIAIIDRDNLIIDKDGVVLSANYKISGLVRIKGVRFAYDIPSPGKKVKAEEVSKALMLLEILKERKIFGGYNLEYIDVSDSNNLLISLDGMKVKMGDSDFSERIEKLSNILKDPNVKIKDISYIDLRFEEIIISPK
jgi:cell division septal protein FtsQ